MRIIIGIILLIISVFIGCGLARKFTKRREFFNSFKDFNLIIQREISYSQSSIPKLLSSIENNDDFYKCIKRYYTNKEFYFESTYLNSQELNFFKQYLMQIGKSDKTSQGKLIESMGEQLSEKLSVATELEQKYKSLYIKLSVLIGLIAFIVCL